MLSTISLVCHACGDLIGELDAAAAHRFGAVGKPGHSADVACPGAGRHAERVTLRRCTFFGLVEVVTTRYPETNTSSSRFQYVGPHRRFLLTLAIVFGGRRRFDGDYEPVYLDGKPCSFSWRGGLSGPGLAALGARPAAAPANDQECTAAKRAA